jgi:hypothetical protein
MPYVDIAANASTSRGEKMATDGENFATAASVARSNP